MNGMRRVVDVHPVRFGEMVFFPSYKNAPSGDASEKWGAHVDNSRRHVREGYGDSKRHSGKTLNYREKSY